MTRERIIAGLRFEESGEPLSDEAIEQLDKAARSAAQLTSVRWRETSGVRMPAGAQGPGWALMKQFEDVSDFVKVTSSGPEEEPLSKAYSTGDTNMAADYLNGCFERCGQPVPDNVKTAAQTVVDFLRSCEPQPIVKGQPRGRSVGDYLLGRR